MPNKYNIKQDITENGHYNQTTKQTCTKSEFELRDKK